MKIVDESGSSELGTQFAFSFEASDTGDQSHLPMPTVITSPQAHQLSACNIVAFPRTRVSSVEARLLARILERTKHFI